eukprot:COSAG04_NODE_356_length_16034_cov_11.195168_17_plen_247_part_00
MGVRPLVEGEKLLSLTAVVYQRGDTAGQLLAAISLLPLVLVVGLATCILCRREVHTCFFLLGQLLTELLNKALKETLRQPRPADAPADDYGMPSSRVLAVYGVLRGLLLQLRAEPLGPPLAARGGWKLFDELRRRPRRLLLADLPQLPHGGPSFCWQRAGNRVRPALEVSRGGRRAAAVPRDRGHGLGSAVSSARREYGGQRLRERCRRCAAGPRAEAQLMSNTCGEGYTRAPGAAACRASQSPVT